jgi:Zn-dependent metalloprotease
MRDYVRTRFDGGGVHVNSGIPNHAFYRAATLLGGRAWEVAGKIWYHALTRRLRATSRFQQCADATFASAGELYGRGSAPHDAVREAWKAVGISVSEAAPARSRSNAIYEIPGAAAEARFFPIA